MSDRLYCLRVCCLPATLLLLLALPGSSMGQSLDKEPNDTPGQAIQLSLPVSAEYGNISSDKDVDFYKLTGRAGTEIVFWAHPNADLDAILAFYDSAGRLLAYNDKEANLGDGSSGVEPILYIKLPSDGNFYVSVSSAAAFGHTGDGADSGKYTLWSFPRQYWSGSDAYEPNDTRLTGKFVTLPFDTYGANLDCLGDIDWYQFAAKAGEKISIDIEALDAEAHPPWLMSVSARMGVFDDGGRLLMDVTEGTDPDNGFRADPAASFEVPRDGKYYIAVTTGADQGYGSIFTDQAFLADPYVSSADHVIGNYRLRLRPSQSIYFPQIANGSFGSIYFATSVILINSGDIESMGQISFFNANGTPMEISSREGGAPSSSFWFRIPPKGDFVLKTDGSGMGASGYAKVEFSGSIGGSAIFSEYDDAGSLITEAAVGASTVMDFFTFPVDVTGDFNTGIAFANPAGTRPVNISLNLLDLSGVSVAEKSVSLDPGKQMAIYVSGLGQLFPNLRNFRGSLQVVADAPVPSVALRSSPRTLTTLPAVSSNQEWDPVTLHFPQMAVGPANNSYRSTIVLTNPGYFTVSGAIRFTRSDGNPMPVSLNSSPGAPVYPFTIRPRGTLFLESGPMLSQTSGYAVLTADHGLGGVVVFSQYDAAGRLLTEAAVPPAPLAQNFLIFAQSDGSYNTGVALANVNQASSVLNYLLHVDSESDDILQCGPEGLDAGKHNAEMIAGPNQLFPAFSGTGVLEVRSTLLVPAVALRMTPTTMTAVPVVPVSK